MPCAATAKAGWPAWTTWSRCLGASRRRSLRVTPGHASVAVRTIAMALAKSLTSSSCVKAASAGASGMVSRSSGATAAAQRSTPNFSSLPPPNHLAGGKSNQLCPFGSGRDAAFAARLRLLTPRRQSSHPRLLRRFLHRPVERPRLTCRAPRPSRQSYAP